MELRGLDVVEHPGVAPEEWFILAKPLTELTLPGHDAPDPDRYWAATVERWLREREAKGGSPLRFPEDFIARDGDGDLWQLEGVRLFTYGGAVA